MYQEQFKYVLECFRSRNINKQKMYGNYNIILIIRVENDVFRFKILRGKNVCFFCSLNTLYNIRVESCQYGTHYKQNDVINRRRAYEYACMYMFLSIVRITSQTSKWHVGFIINQVSIRLCKYLIFFFFFDVFIEPDFPPFDRYTGAF